MRRASLPAGALAVALVFFGCDRSPSSPSAAALVVDADPVVEVETVRVERGAIGQRVFAPGSLVARRESRIGAEVRGRIERVYVSEGDRVEAGEPLFKIDSETYEMALREAEAGLDVARAERQQLESDLKRARTLQRQQVIPEQEIERLATSLVVARARGRQASEAVALARHNLAQTLVGAPYPGSVAARLADEGTTALVQPQTIVVVLQETAELEARASIAESQVSVVQVGDRALVHVEGLSDPIETEVSAVSDTIDIATHTYLVKMRVPNQDYRLKAGVFAHIEILPKAKSEVIVVPRDAVYTEAGRSRLLIVRDGRATAIPVELGVVSEDAVEVLQGVSVGDEVLVGEAASKIAPGMRVRVLPATQGASS